MSNGEILCVVLTSIVCILLISIMIYIPIIFEREITDLIKKSKQKTEL